MIKTNHKTLRAFEALDQIWGRNLVPWHLERHYFLYWFAFYRGDLDQTAEAHRVHRNTIQFHFDRFGLTEKSDDLCRLWENVEEKNKSASFESNFFKFYQMNELKNELNAAENKVLIRLWQDGFSFKTIGAHYMLWALRKQKSKEWIQKKLGCTSHHCMRVLVTILDPQTENGRWLAPLHPRSEEIYTRGPRDPLTRARLAERQLAVSE